MNQKIFKLFIVIAILSLMMAACGTPAPVATEAPAAVEEPMAEPAATEAPVVEEPAMPEALPQGQELADAYAGMYDGTVVTMAGPFTDADAVKFDELHQGI